MQAEILAENSAAAAAAAQNGGQQEPALPSSRHLDLRQRLREKQQQARSCRRRGPGSGENSTGGVDREGDVAPAPHEAAVSAYCQGPLLRPGVMAALAHLGGGVPLMQLMDGLLAMQPIAGPCAPGVVAAAAALLPVALQVATSVARDLLSLLGTTPASAPGRRRSALKATAGGRSTSNGDVARANDPGAHEPGLSRTAGEAVVPSEHLRKVPSGVGDGDEPDSRSTGFARGAGEAPIGDGAAGSGCAAAAAISGEQLSAAGSTNAGTIPCEGPKAAGEAAKRQRKQAEARLVAATALFTTISFGNLDVADQLLLWAAASPLDCAVAVLLLDLAEAAVQVPPTPLCPWAPLPPAPLGFQLHSLVTQQQQRASVLLCAWRRQISGRALPEPCCAPRSHPFLWCGADGDCPSDEATGRGPGGKPCGPERRHGLCSAHWHFQRCSHAPAAAAAAAASMREARSGDGWGRRGASIRAATSVAGVQHERSHKGTAPLLPEIIVLAFACMPIRLESPSLPIALFQSASLLASVQCLLEGALPLNPVALCPLALC